MRQSNWVASAVLTAVGFASSSSFSSAAVLLNTSFESPGYTNAAQLSATSGWSGGGQDTTGWAISNATVDSHAGTTGSQWVLVTGLSPTVLSRREWQNTPVSDFSTNSVITASVNTRIDTGSPGGTAVNRSAETGLQMRDAAGIIDASLYIENDIHNDEASPNGARWYIVQGFQDGSRTLTQIDAATGTYFNLSIAIDYSTGLVTDYVNGTALDVTGSTTATDFQNATMASLRLTTSAATPAGFNRFGFDDLIVTQTAVPEPASLGILSIGSALVLRRRSRRSQVSRAMKKSPAALAVCAASALTANSFGQTATFSGLGDLPGGGAGTTRSFLSSATAISADGSTIVGEGNGNDGNQAFRWTFAGQTLQALGGVAGVGTARPFLSQATAVSYDGTVVVGNALTPFADTTNEQQGFRWTASTGLVAIGYLPQGANTKQFSQGAGVSGDGSVIAGWGQSASSGPNNVEASRWTSSTGQVGLGELPAPNFASAARGISYDGNTIVGQSNSYNNTPGSLTPMIWTNPAKGGNGMQSLGYLPGDIGTGTGGEAFAVSGDGKYVVGASTSSLGAQAFLWSAGSGMVGLGDVAGGSFFSRALAVDGDGSVVVGISISGSGTVASIWTPQTGMVALSDYLASLGISTTGWTLSTANGISADGTKIVGTGIDPAGNQEAFYAIIPPVPEPGTAGLIGTAIVGALTRRTRRKSS